MFRTYNLTSNIVRLQRHRMVDSLIVNDGMAFAVLYMYIILQGITFGRMMNIRGSHDYHLHE